MLKYLPFILFLSACVQNENSIRNTQINSDFIALTAERTPEQLAELAYQQAKEQYHGKFLDKCTEGDIQLSGRQVILNFLLHDNLCGNSVRKASIAEHQALMKKGKAFRIKEIKQVPTAIATLNGGVIQVYRYYLLPERQLIGEFEISAKDLK